MAISWFSFADSSFDSSDGLNFLKMLTSFEQDCAARFNFRFFLSGIITLIKNFNLYRAKTTSWQLYILSFFTSREQMKILYLLYSGICFLFLFLLGSNSVPTRCYSALLGSYLVHIILCTKLGWFCAVIFIKPTIKKPKQNNTEQKESVLQKYYN